MDKKIYYTSDGKNVFIGANNMSDADVKTNLGIAADADYFTAEINNIYEPATPSYSVSLSPSQYADTGGDATIKLLDNTIKAYLNNHTFDDLTGKRVYYKNDGSSAFVGDRTASPGADYKSAPISVHKPYKSYSSFRVKSVKTLNPITLQIGETAEKADKLNIPLYDLHTDAILKGETKLVAVTRPYQNSGSQGGASLSGNQSGSSTNVNQGNGPTSGTITTYEERSVNSTKKNDKSAYENGISLNISTQDDAISNIDFIKTASNKISLYRGSYGALENRLDYTVNNHSNTSENMAAAKSRIKDTDMAKEMMKYTQANVLTQTAQAMLAQANTQPQNVLSLLQ